MLSVNEKAFSLVTELINEAERYGVEVKETDSGTTLIDAGIRAEGGFSAGRLITEICLGGYGRAELSSQKLGEISIPAILVYTDHPAISTLGSQFAGWNVRYENYSAMGSGPARALALKPKELYESISYRDESDLAVIVLETSKEPPEPVLSDIARKCRVDKDELYVILTPTTSLAGSVQISGRVVETGMHRLTELGLDPKTVKYAWGIAPISPPHPKTVKAMGRTNDAITYGGVTGYCLYSEDEDSLKEILRKAPSSASRSYGKPFAEIFKEAGYDFYKIDPGFFAPAVITITNVKTGNSFTAGKVNPDILRESFGVHTL